MKINDEQKQKLEELYQTFLHDPKIQRMKDIPMHRGSNCYEHVFKVAKRAIKRSLNSHYQNIDLEVVILGAILHDYYLYDWRSDRSKRKGHGRQHPSIAADNAFKDFDISPEVRKVIESHMWPLKIKEYPSTREAKIVSLSDKGVTICEALTSIKHKQKKRDIYLSYISRLFD